MHKGGGRRGRGGGTLVLQGCCWVFGWNQVLLAGLHRLIVGGGLANAMLMELSVITYALLGCYYYLIGIENILLKCLQG